MFIVALATINKLIENKLTYMLSKFEEIMQVRSAWNVPLSAEAEYKIKPWLSLCRISLHVCTRPGRELAKQK